MRGADQPEVAFVDEVRERDTLVLVLLRDRDDEPQVGADQLVEGLGVALLDALRERHLFLAGNQRILTDLAEILIEGPFIVRRPLRRVQLHGVFSPPPRQNAARNPFPWCAPTARPRPRIRLRRTRAQ